jgi:type I site-specific restriction endonuclease
MSCGERRNSVPFEKSPKEKKYVSNITYFGKPVYNYSLKQKIEDGFLAPFGLSVLTSTRTSRVGRREMKRLAD